MASASVEGTIQNVTYKDEKSGYTVLKVAALHTAGEPPEQRTNAAQWPSRAGKGAPLALSALCTFLHLDATACHSWQHKALSAVHMSPPLSCVASPNTIRLGEGTPES